MENSWTSQNQTSSGTRVKSSSSIMCSRSSPGSSGSALKRAELSMGPGCSFRSAMLDESRAKYKFSRLNQHSSTRYLCRTKLRLFINTARFNPTNKKISALKNFKKTRTFLANFVRISGFQIPFKIWTICNPTSFRPFKIQSSPDFRSPLY